MHIKITKILLEELIYQFETMISDEDFREDNTESIHITDSIYNKLENNNFEFTEKEFKELVDEIGSCEDMDYWQEPEMKKAVKIFRIENKLLVKVTDEEYNKMCEGYKINPNIIYKPSRYKYKGVFYVDKEDYKFYIGEYKNGQRRSY